MPSRFSLIKYFMNIINAIVNLVSNPITNLKDVAQGNNRANSAGAALEEYMKDLFSGSFNLPESQRIKKHSEVFSYLGNDSNPPDAMLKNGDAIEVKKIETRTSALALNSSYPKHTLLANNPMISTACRNAEEWQEKDIIYMVGFVKDMELKDLCMVYGLDYCVSDEEIQKEASRFLFHLNIKNFSLFNIEINNPFQFFSDVYTLNEQSIFNFMAIINNKKWDKLTNRELLYKLGNIEIKDIFLKRTNNPAKLITFSF